MYSSIALLSAGLAANYILQQPCVRSFKRFLRHKNVDKVLSNCSLNVPHLLQL
jgi:hypothetical protein